MLLLLATVPAALVPATRVHIQATATVRIQRSRALNEYEWKHTPKISRREVIIHDEEGRPILLRLVEYE